MPRKRKVFYAYSCGLLGLNDQSNEMEDIAYDSSTILQIFQEIQRYPPGTLGHDIEEQQKAYVLDSVRIHNNGQNQPEAIYGSFIWTDYGLQTPWLSRGSNNTWQRRNNQKRPGEGEERKCYFAIRLVDGFCLFDGNDLLVNPININRFAEFIIETVQSVFSDPVVHLRFTPLLRPDFTEKILQYEAIYSFDLQIDTTNPPSPEHQDGSFHQIAALSNNMRSRFITVSFARQDKKSDLDPRVILDALLDLFQGEERVIAAKIKGKFPEDMHEDGEIRLSGLKEKHQKSLELLEDGSFNQNAVIEYMLEVIFERNRI